MTRQEDAQELSILRAAAVATELADGFISGVGEVKNVRDEMEKFEVKMQVDEVAGPEKTGGEALEVVTEEMVDEMQVDAVQEVPSKGEVANEQNLTKQNPKKSEVANVQSETGEKAEIENRKDKSKDEVANEQNRTEQNQSKKETQKSEVANVQSETEGKAEVENRKDKSKDEAVNEQNLIEQNLSKDEVMDDQSQEEAKKSEVVNDQSQDETKKNKVMNGQSQEEEKTEVENRKDKSKNETEKVEESVKEIKKDAGKSEKEIKKVQHSKEKRDVLGAIMVDMDKTLGPVKKAREDTEPGKKEGKKDKSEEAKHKKTTKEKERKEGKKDKSKEAKHKDRNNDKDKENFSKRKRESEDNVVLYVKDKELAELDGADLEEGEIRESARDKLKSYTIPKKQKVEVRSIVSRPPRRDLHDYRRHHHH